MMRGIFTSEKEADSMGVSLFFYVFFGGIIEFCIV
jgi:hypothetical protein